MPSRLGNEPSQPPENTSANAFSRLDPATSKPGLSQSPLPSSDTTQRTASPIRHVISISRPNSVLGNVQIAPTSVSSSPPNDQCPLGSARLTGSLPQNARRL